MKYDAVFIPTLLCALGVILWQSETNSLNSDELLSWSKNYANTLSDKSDVRSRLSRIGRDGEYATFRLRQFSWMLISGGVCFAMGLMAFTSLFVASLFGMTAGIGMYFWIDRRLNQEVTHYRLSIESEFASIIEMLTLSLSAGETPMGAMARVASRSTGVLAREFGRVIDSVRTGVSFQEALDAFGRRVDSVLIRRFVDSLINAMSRGAPLIEVLQRHAAEARQNQRNILMDKAGRAEISMMVPVVFLILPISVLFALWPSLTHLNGFAF